jgi:Tfp pilus assembly protein PilN
MVEVNLLPWRDQQKLYEKKIVKNLLFAAVFFSLFLNFLIHCFMTARIETLNSHVTLLQEEVLKLETLQRQVEETRKHHDLSQQWLQQLTQYQAETTHLFTGLINRPIKNICFTALSRAANTITFLGYARSAIDLKEWLSSWGPAQNFFAIKIENLHEQKANQIIHFRFIAIEKNKLAINALNKEKDSNDAV